MKTLSCMRIPRLAVFVFLVSVTIMNSFCHTAAAAPYRQKLHMKHVKLYDANGLGQPIVARSFLMPADWQVAGGVQWSTHYDPNQPAYFESFSAMSPDGRVSFDMLPAYSWIWFADRFVR